MFSGGRYTFSISDLPLYPYMKITGEPFPRLLSTRRVEEDGAEYFGPFLTRSAARILIDFLNTTFRLRTCTVPIDGDFPVPCTQYYARRCVAPCVSSLCGPLEYSRRVEMARLFLRDDRREFQALLMALMDSAAEALEFEQAAAMRDILSKVQAFWNHPRRQVWTGDAVDTYVFDRESDPVHLYIVTTRRARTLGSWVGQFHVFEDTDLREVLSDTIAQFYPVGAPREIRVPFDFPGRHEQARELRRRSGNAVKIIVEGQVPERVTALKALARTKLHVDLENLKPVVTPEKVKRQLVKMFGLGSAPSRIAAFDAAHISGTFSTAGMSVWREGRMVSEEYRAGMSEESGEVATLRQFMTEQFLSPDGPATDMVLVDGGTAHVNAAVKALAAAGLTHIPVVGAVKPPKRHGEVSHFLAADGTRVDFNEDSVAMRALRLLRDEAHEIANGAHSLSRDMSHFYELAEILPSLNEARRQSILARMGSIRKILESDKGSLVKAFGESEASAIAADIEKFESGPSAEVRPPIVPIRYDDPNGEAGDLRPIRTANRDLLMQ